MVLDVGRPVGGVGVEGVEEALLDSGRFVESVLDVLWWQIGHKAVPK